MFLEYCYAKLHFDRYFNDSKHKAYAVCSFCKGRDNLRKIENIKTAATKWCCETCRTNMTDESVIDVPAAKDRKKNVVDDGYIRAEKNGTEI